MCISHSLDGGRRGYTLIEMLVAITVIGLLVGLVLSAVQRAREAARRVHCVANLRQIGIAMNAYHGVHHMFPPSQLLTGRYYSANYYSSHSYILPYLELNDLYCSINMSFVGLERPAGPAKANHTARNTRVATFLCPSDGEPEHMNSYRFNKGRFGVRRPSHPFDGPFSIGNYPSQASVSDGLSKTAFVSECIAGTFTSASSDIRNTKLVRSPPILITTDAQLIDYCVQDVPSFWAFTGGRYWFFSGLSNTSYNHNGVPNDRRTSCGRGSYVDVVSGLVPPRSFHGGSVNVLMGDGHVESASDSIDLAVWTALGTHDGADN